MGQPNLVGDVGQELVAADPIIEAAQEDLEQVAVHLVAGDLLEIFLTHLGARRQTQPVGFPLKDQGVDNVSVLGRAERMRAQIRIQLGHEHVGEGPLLEHLIECAAIHCLAEKFRDRLIAPAVAGIEQLGQTVRDHEAEHGQDREDGEQLTLVAPKYLKRHGVPRVSIVAIG